MYDSTYMRNEELVFKGHRISVGKDKKVLEMTVLTVQNTVNVLKANELYTYAWQILCYRCLITTKTML